MSDLPFLVAGGGIGGLAAALGLAGHGRPVRLFEQAPSFEEVGAGLQMSPNGVRPCGHSAPGRRSSRPASSRPKSTCGTGGPARSSSASGWARPSRTASALPTASATGQIFWRACSPPRGATGNIELNTGRKATGRRGPEGQRPPRLRRGPIRHGPRRHRGGWHSLHPARRDRRASRPCLAARHALPRPHAAGNGAARDRGRLRDALALPRAGMWCITRSATGATSTSWRQSTAIRARRRLADPGRIGRGGAPLRGRLRGTGQPARRPCRHGCAGRGPTFRSCPAGRSGNLALLGDAAHATPALSRTGRGDGAGGRRGAGARNGRDARSTAEAFRAYERQRKPRALAHPGAVPRACAASITPRGRRRLPATSPSTSPAPPSR